MKLKYFEHIDAYRYLLIFENDEQKDVDLIDLIGKHVSLEQLNTAHIDPEWGCLEFNAYRAQNLVSVCNGRGS